MGGFLHDIIFNYSGSNWLMKKSIVVSTSSTKFSALAFKENLKGSIKKIADLGFDGAELAVRNPKDLEIVF